MTGAGSVVGLAIGAAVVAVVALTSAFTALAIILGLVKAGLVLTGVTLCIVGLSVAWTKAVARLR